MNRFSLELCLIILFLLDMCLVFDGDSSGFPVGVLATVHLIVLGLYLAFATIPEYAKKIVDTNNAKLIRDLGVCSLLAIMLLVLTISGWNGEQYDLQETKTLAAFAALGVVAVLSILRWVYRGHLRKNEKLEGTSESKEESE